MTVALLFQTRFSQRVFWISSPEPDRGLVALLVFCLVLVCLGLAADVAGGRPVGTVALWPALIAAGVTLGVFIVEVLRCFRVA